jgi:hypothetical protein
MEDKDAEAVIDFIYDHLDPRYKTRLGLLPTAWAVFRRVLISEGYGDDAADALLWEWEEHHCQGSVFLHLRPGGEECERAKKIRYFPVITRRRGSHEE